MLVYNIMYGIYNIGTYNTLLTSYLLITTNNNIITIIISKQII